VGSTAGADRVVLLHGQPGAGIEWHGVVAALDGAAELLAPDRPGYGDNPLGAIGFDANVDWLVQLLEEGGGRRAAVIVAHSWAGGVALSLALRRPDLTRGLVLVGSVGPGAITRTDRVLARPLVGAVAARTATRVASPILRWRLTRSGLDEHTRIAMLDALSASRARRVWRTFRTEQAALVHELPALFDRLGHIAAPTTIVGGARDRVVRPATATALAAQVPDAELVTIPGGGHQLHRTHPELIAGVVRRVLAESARP